MPAKWLARSRQTVSRSRRYDGFSRMLVRRRWNRVAFLSIAMSTIAGLPGCSSTSGVPAIDAPVSDADAHVEVGTDAPGHCGYSYDRANIRVFLANGNVSSCNPPGIDAAATVSTVTGTITGGDASTLLIDGCDGSQSCVPSSIRIEIDAPGLDLTSIPRVPVEVKFQF